MSTQLLPSTFSALLVASAVAADPLDDPATQWRADVPELVQTSLFVSGRDGYDTFRIPALLTTPVGSVLAFCEGRRNSAGDAGDIDLLMRRSTDGGETFGPIEVIWDEGANTCGNPCPVVDEASGDIVLLMTHNLGHDHESRIIAGESEGTRSVWLSRSRDHGATWSAPTDITAQAKRPDWSWYATGPGVGISLRLGPHKGRLVIPCDHLVLGDRESYYSHCIYSDDGGLTWHIGESLGTAVNECQVIERSDGSLLLNMRCWPTSGSQHRAIAASEDGGASWGPVTYDPALPDPRCQASLVRYSPSDEAGDPLVMFSNAASPTSRTNMTVRLSLDDGRTWPRSLVLNEGPSAYSALQPLPDGRVGCLYEGGADHPYERIVLARFPLDLLQ